MSLINDLLDVLNDAVNTFKDSALYQWYSSARPIIWIYEALKYIHWIK